MKENASKADIRKIGVLLVDLPAEEIVEHFFSKEGMVVISRKSDIVLR